MKMKLQNKKSGRGDRRRSRVVLNDDDAEEFQEATTPEAESKDEKRDPSSSFSPKQLIEQEEAHSPERFNKIHMKKEEVEIEDTTKLTSPKMEETSKPQQFGPKSFQQADTDLIVEEKEVESDSDEVLPQSLKVLPKGTSSCLSMELLEEVMGTRLRSRAVVTDPKEPLRSIGSEGDA
eukprot:UN29126